LELDRRADLMRDTFSRSLAARRARLDDLGQRVQREHPQSRLGRAARTLTALSQAARDAQRSRLTRERARLTSLSMTLQTASPASAISRQHRKLALLRERSEKALTRRFADQRVRLSRAAARLESLSPLSVLSRGYAIAFDAARRVLKTAADAKVGARVHVLLSDRSEIEAQVLPRSSDDPE
jgi:exodeoxyribonuclease VII large subunit